MVLRTRTSHSVPRQVGVDGALGDEGEVVAEEGCGFAVWVRERAHCDICSGVFS